MGFPSDVKIEKEIPLSLFYKNGRMTDVRKRNLIKYTASINTLVNLKSDVSKLKKTPFYCPEIQVLEVHVKTQFIGWMEMNDYIRSIMQAIPYPVICIINYKNTHRGFAVAKLRSSKQDTKHNIVDKILVAYWTDTNAYSDDSIVKSLSTSYNKGVDLATAYNDFYREVESFVKPDPYEDLNYIPTKEEIETARKLQMEYEDEEFHIRQMLRGY